VCFRGERSPDGADGEFFARLIIGVEHLYGGHVTVESELLSRVGSGKMSHNSLMRMVQNNRSYTFGIGCSSSGSRNRQKSTSR
jgi:hypothetical protein